MASDEGREEHSLDLAQELQQKPLSSSQFIAASMRSSLQFLCASKVQEFRRYGYQNVTQEQIWRCVTENYGPHWPRPHRLANDILSLKPNHFMNWIMLSIYKRSSHSKSTSM